MFDPHQLDLWVKLGSMDVEEVELLKHVQASETRLMAYWVYRLQGKRPPPEVIVRAMDRMTELFKLANVSLSKYMHITDSVIETIWNHLDVETRQALIRESI